VRELPRCGFAAPTEISADDLSAEKRSRIREGHRTRTRPSPISPLGTNSYRECLKCRPPAISPKVCGARCRLKTTVYCEQSPTLRATRIIATTKRLVELTTKIRSSNFTNLCPRTSGISWMMSVGDLPTEIVGVRLFEEQSRCSLPVLRADGPCSAPSWNWPCFMIVSSI
jgi:hypothetical protein